MSASVFLPRKPSKGISFSLPSKTQKHLAKMCDVRTMIARALNGDTTVYRKGLMLDVSDAPEDMQEYLNKINAGREAFDSLPADVRRVYPTPEIFMAACNDPSERERLCKLGIFEKVEKPSPVDVRVIADKATAPSDGAACPNT